MDRNSAIQALNDGKKLTHTYFAPYEWVKGIGNGDYQFEDGIKCNSREFWNIRTESGFDNGWKEIA